MLRLSKLLQPSAKAAESNAAGRGAAKKKEEEEEEEEEEEGREVKVDEVELAGGVETRGGGAGEAAFTRR